MPDAWVDHDKTKIGYEIPLTRHFYMYVPPRPLEEIDAEIKAWRPRSRRCSPRSRSERGSVPLKRLADRHGLGRRLRPRELDGADLRRAASRTSMATGGARRSQNMAVSIESQSRRLSGGLVVSPGSCTKSATGDGRRSTSARATRLL